MKKFKQISREERDRLFWENCHEIEPGLWEIDKDFEGKLIAREPLVGDFDYCENESLYPVKTTFVLITDENERKI